MKQHFTAFTMSSTDDKKLIYNSRSANTSKYLGYMSVKKSNRAIQKYLQSLTPESIGNTANYLSYQQHIPPDRVKKE